MEKWSLDVEGGQIRDADGWALATVPHAIAGDASNLAACFLMSKAPELLQLVKDLAAALQVHMTDSTASLRGSIIAQDAQLLGWARALTAEIEGGPQSGTQDAGRLE